MYHIKPILYGKISHDFTRWILPMIILQVCQWPTRYISIFVLVSSLWQGQRSNPEAWWWNSLVPNYHKCTLIARFTGPTWGLIWGRQNPGGPHVWSHELCYLGLTTHTQCAYYGSPQIETLVPVNIKFHDCHTPKTLTMLLVIKDILCMA